MPKVPGSQNSTIAHSKISYLLKPRSVSDKSKFFLMFSFSLQNPQELTDALYEHVNTHDYVSMRPTYDETDPANPILIGYNYTVRCNLKTPDGRNPCIRTVWTILIGSSAPHFTTAYPR